MTLYTPLLFAQCGLIECYDPCTHSNVQLEGDKCSVTWNETEKCFEAYTECGNSKKCLGALCYDGCANRYQYFTQANTCSYFFDPAKLCTATLGNCE